MHLDERDGDRGQGIAQRNARVGVGCGVGDNKVHAFRARGLHPVNEAPFGVALEAADFDALPATGRLQASIDLGQGLTSVDFRFARAKQVEVGTMKNQDGPFRVFASSTHFCARRLHFSSLSTHIRSRKPVPASRGFNPRFLRLTF